MIDFERPIAHRIANPMPFLRAVDPPQPEQLSTSAEPAPELSPIVALGRAAAAGDPQATTRLLRELGPRMVRTVHVLMGSSHPDVDDVVQQALIAFIQALSAFRGECSPAHYASRIAVRTAVAARRRARTREGRQDASVDPDDMAATHDGPSESLSAPRPLPQPGQ